MGGEGGRGGGVANPHAARRARRLADSARNPGRGPIGGGGGGAADARAAATPGGPRNRAVPIAGVRGGRGGGIGERLRDKGVQFSTEDCMQSRLRMGVGARDGDDAGEVSSATVAEWS